MIQCFPIYTYLLQTQTMSLSLYYSFGRLCFLTSVKPESYHLHGYCALVVLVPARIASFVSTHMAHSAESLDSMNKHCLHASCTSSPSTVVLPTWPIISIIYLNLTRKFLQVPLHSTSTSTTTYFKSNFELNFIIICFIEVYCLTIMCFWWELMAKHKLYKPTEFIHKCPKSGKVTVVNKQMRPECNGTCRCLKAL